jgi:hypothetical protein
MIILLLLTSTIFVLLYFYDLLSVQAIGEVMVAIVGFSSVGTTLIQLSYKDETLEPKIKKDEVKIGVK